MRILLADDHPMIRTALEALLRDTEFEIVGTAGTGEAALAEVERLRPEILLLDLQMPGGNGMDVLRHSCGQDAIASHPANGRDRRLIVTRSQIAESTGIVLKNSDPAYLLDCLDRVRHGRSWFDPELAERAKQLAGAVSSGDRVPLAPRERQLIGFVRTGLRNREIAERLGVTEGTVKAYLHAVFEKLGVSSRTELAIRADEFLA